MKFMKFLKGFTLGTVAGIAIGSTISEQQRQQIVQRVKKQAEPIRRAVVENADDVVDAATQQAAGAVDHAGAAVVDSIDGAEATSAGVIGSPRPI